MGISRKDKRSAVKERETIMDIYVSGSPYWSRLKEAMCGEVSDRLIGYKSLADGMDIDIFSFTQDDVLKCKSIDDLPDDWRKLADKCIDVYNIK